MLSQLRQTPMRWMRALVLCCPAIFGLWYSPSMAWAEDGSRHTQYATHYIGDARRHARADFCFGPTGAWGFMHHDRFVITSVVHNSPSDGLLQPHDAIVGAGGRRLTETHDARQVLGEAITRSETEAGGGRLVLRVNRNGREINVVVQIPIMGSYSETWPFDCPKSDRIFDEACEYLYHHGSNDWGTFGSLNHLCLLASEDPTYLDYVRRGIYFNFPDPLSSGRPGAWNMSYGGILLAEYYLATGDSSVLDNLQEMVDLLAANQTTGGTWGHGINYRHRGYGAVNQVGLACALALVMADECGLNVDQEAKARSLNFFGQYAGRGVPYGEHSPFVGPGDNGKNALAAVLFAVDGQRPRVAQSFAEMVPPTWPYREVGHTGPFFSYTWGPVGAAHDSDDGLHHFMDNQSWNYALMRQHNGALQLLGRRDTYSQHSMSTGGLLLSYALSRRNLRILGGEKGIFGQAPPEGAERALTAFQQKEWNELEREIERILQGNGPEEQKTYARELSDAHVRLQASADHTLQLARENIASGDYYTAWQQIESLKMLLGSTFTVDDEIAESLASQNMEQVKRQWTTLQNINRHSNGISQLHGLITAGGSIEQLRAVANGEGYYAEWARQMVPLAAVDADKTPECEWQSVFAMDGDNPSAWRYQMWNEAELVADDATTDALDNVVPVALENWWYEECEDGDWPSAAGTFSDHTRSGSDGHYGPNDWKTDRIVMRTTFQSTTEEADAYRLLIWSAYNTQVYLNGHRIFDCAKHTGPAAVTIDLRSTVGELLRDGENTLAVYSERENPGVIKLNLDRGIIINEEQ